MPKLSNTERLVTMIDSESSSSSPDTLIFETSPGNKNLLNHENILYDIPT